jgi:cytochrome c-type biogenesis protein
VVIGSSVPFSIALTAGGIAVVNPCAFPMLPAFLSFYVGADEQRLPTAPTKAVQGLLVGGLVATGFLGVFAVVGVPVSLGLGAVSDAIPWVGLATGAALALAGLITLAGVSVRLPAPVLTRVPVRRERTLGAIVLFGIGYGAASLGCTLPVFLTLVGASLGATSLTVFLAYGIGMTIVLMALAVLVAFARGGILRFFRPLLPHVRRLTGVLLAISGTYLVYYWARIRFGNQLTLADDPVVGPVSRYSGQLETFAHHHGAPLLVAAAAVIGVVLVGLLTRRRQSAKAIRHHRVPR